MAYAQWRGATSAAAPLLCALCIPWPAASSALGPTEQQPNFTPMRAGKQVAQWGKDLRTALRVGAFAPVCGAQYVDVQHRGRTPLKAAASLQKP
eukprot:CAMPEP_0179033288 /NCGR_PEP_ID=MMETSP0796-20121207/12027_1 /TAXON_ID=73915 /ORGANISM="Pyrodinium bahamense, Strain pbaha01" /LENGTH=93 /DNA_ID=CAMNT_0020729543 /DNA_START=388 /DNA_END=669 /DNA_ORIENTATION=+